MTSFFLPRIRKTIDPITACAQGIDMNGIDVTRQEIVGKKLQYSDGNNEQAEIRRLGWPWRFGKADLC